MEESKAQTESKNPNIDNLVNNYIDDIFSNASDKLQKGNTKEQETHSNYIYNRNDNIHGRYIYTHYYYCGSGSHQGLTLRIAKHEWLW